MSKSFLNPKIETSVIEGTKNAQKYFAETFNDNSFVLYSAMPSNVYQCYTEQNPNEKYYFKIQ